MEKAIKKSYRIFYICNCEQEFFDDFNLLQLREWVYDFHNTIFSFILLSLLLALFAQPILEKCVLSTERERENIKI